MLESGSDGDGGRIVGHGQHRCGVDPFDRHVEGAAEGVDQSQAPERDLAAEQRVGGAVGPGSVVVVGIRRQPADVVDPEELLPNPVERRRGHVER